MSLYVRLQSSFWNHRKTLRLRAQIGEAGFWIPPRLWSYAAENQPDGDFSSYSAAELAMLLAYPGDAQAMLEAMQQAGFMDEMKIHDWQEHNAYHSTFSERAKTAARARWDKEAEKKLKRNERKRKEPSIATSIACPNGSASLSSKERCSQIEAESFCVSIGLPASDGAAMFLHWEEKGWAKVKDWRLTIRKWQSFGYLPSQKASKGGKFQPMSAGELERKTRSEREYQEAQDRRRKRLAEKND